MLSEQIASLPSTFETQVSEHQTCDIRTGLTRTLCLSQPEDNSYNAKVALQLALEEFKSDLTMSSLTDSSERAT